MNRREFLNTTALIPCTRFLGNDDVAQQQPKSRSRFPYIAALYKKCKEWPKVQNVLIGTGLNALIQMEYLNSMPIHWQYWYEKELPVLRQVGKIPLCVQPWMMQQMGFVLMLDDGGMHIGIISDNDLE